MSTPTKPKAKSRIITFRPSASTKEILERRAREQKRSLTSLIEEAILVTHWPKNGKRPMPAIGA
jgi:hypothetical protein